MCNFEPTDHTWDHSVQLPPMTNYILAFIPFKNLTKATFPLFFITQVCPLPQIIPRIRDFMG